MTLFFSFGMIKCRKLSKIILYLIFDCQVFMGSFTSQTQELQKIASKYQTERTKIYGTDK